jgi:hypothetical protein
MGGVRKLSSLGKIRTPSFLVNPSFFSRFMSWFEILDLSHSETSRSCVAMLASGVVCLVSLAHGGINVGAGEIEDEDERRSLFWLQWKLLDRERIGAQRSEGDF